MSFGKTKPDIHPKHVHVSQHSHTRSKTVTVETMETPSRQTALALTGGPVAREMHDGKSHGPPKYRKAGKLTLHAFILCTDRSTKQQQRDVNFMATTTNEVQFVL